MDAFPEAAATIVSRVSESDVARAAQAQADLFGGEGHGIAPRSAQQGVAWSGRRHTPALPDPECAARLLDAHDDYRVLRRLAPRPVDGDYRLGPGCD